MELTLDNYQEIIQGYPSTDFIFRGHENERWEITSTLNRSGSTEIQRNESEYFRALTDEFIKRGINPRNRVRDPKAPTSVAGQWLALFRHYGLPTRIIDFTNDFHIAVYFASFRSDSLDGCVYAINTHTLVSSLRDRYPAFMRENFPVLSQGPVMGKIECGLLTEDTYFRIIANVDENFAIPIAPSISNLRESAQKGVYMIYSAISRPLEDVLTNYPQGCLQKILIRADTKRALREHLYRNEQLSHHRLFHPVEWAIDDIKSKTDLPF